MNFTGVKIISLIMRGHEELSKVTKLLYQMKSPALKERPCDFFKIVCKLILQQDDESAVYLFTQLTFMLQNECSVLDSVSTAEDFVSEVANYRHYSEEKSSHESMEVVEEGFVTCKRCSSKRVEWTTSHCRSADEGSTVFFRCSECEKQWKHYA